MSIAASKISPGEPEDPMGAIILYSLTSTWCTFSATNSFPYLMVYSTTNATAALHLRDSLLVSTAQTIISVDTSDINGNNSTSNDGFGSSPTTAVAMIILYSITGIITALFLIIIITGAVRAHRHPERYGPRLVPGRTRQSRAKGIARAMLDTLPIVKFGEREEPKPTDVELAQPEAGSSEVTTVKAEGEAATESGLACSVCTDDFVHGQDIRVLPCNHQFHPECIDPWLLNVSGTCPLW